jgi:hypothetical protein
MRTISAIRCLDILFCKYSLVEAVLLLTCTRERPDVNHGRIRNNQNKVSSRVFIFILDVPLCYVYYKIVIKHHEETNYINFVIHLCSYMCQPLHHHLLVV